MPRTALLFAALVLTLASLRAEDAPQSGQTDDSDSHAYRSPRAERRYDNHQQAIENHQTAAANRAANAQANADDAKAKRDSAKAKLDDAEAKKKDNQLAKREAAQEKKDAANLTSDKLPDAEADAAKQLTDLATLPDGAGAEAVKALRSKTLAITLQSEAVPVWDLCARTGDVARVPADAYGVATLVDKGTLALIAGLDPDKAAPVPDALQTKAQAWSAIETLDQDLLAARIKDAHTAKKQFIAAPAAALIAAWGPEKTATILKDADAVVLPIEKWCADDKTSLREDFAATVRKFIAALRASNPKTRIFLGVGAKVDPDATGGTAADWLTMLEPVLLKDAASFDGIAVTIVKTKPTDDPKLGLGAFKQLCAWLRPPPYAPIAPAAGTAARSTAGPAPATPGAATNASASATASPEPTLGTGTKETVDGTVGK